MSDRQWEGKPVQSGRDAWLIEENLQNVSASQSVFVADLLGFVTDCQHIDEDFQVEAVFNEAIRQITNIKVGLMERNNNELN